MQDLIAKAATLLEALPYIQKFSGETFVVKYGGSFMDSPDPKVRTGVGADIVFLEAVGINPVVVHGGGKAITKAMEKSGLEVQFVQGRRYTDQRTLTVVEQVLCNEINRQIVSTIETLGSSAMGLHTLGSCVLFGDKLFLEEEGRKIDLGFVGHVTSVNSRLLELLC